jgi:hypothetical protein
MSSKDEDDALEGKEVEPLQKFDNIGFRNRNGAAYQVPLGQNDDNESSENDIFETESSQSYRVSSSPRLADTATSISNEIREAYKLGNWSPTSKAKWDKHKSQRKGDELMLLDVTGKAIALKLTNTPKVDVNKPKAEYYFPTITDGRKRISDSSKPRTILSAEGEICIQDQQFTLGDFVACTRLEAKIISEQLSTSKQVILQRATSEYVKTVSQLAVNKKETSTQSEARIDIIDGVRYYKPANDRMVGCIHCIQYYVDRFIAYVFEDARDILKSLSPNDIEIFSISVKKLVRVSRSLLEDHSTRSLTLCGEVCDWKSLIHMRMFNKIAALCPTNIRSSCEMLFDLKIDDIRESMKDDTFELTVAEDDQLESVLNNFINEIYQEAYDLLEYLPTEEAKFLRKGIRSFIESVREMQSRRVSISNKQCGLRCCNWFRKKEPVTACEARILKDWEKNNPSMKSNNKADEKADDSNPTTLTDSVKETPIQTKMMSERNSSNA